MEHCREASKDVRKQDFALLPCSITNPSNTACQNSKSASSCSTDPAFRQKMRKKNEVSKLTNNKLLPINIGSTPTGGRNLTIKGNHTNIQLTSPACTEVGEKVALS